MTNTLELRMPVGYMDMSAEEMEYLEGGGTVKLTLTKAFVNWCVGKTTYNVAKYIHARFNAINFNSIYGALQIQYGAKVDRREVSKYTMRWTSKKLRSATKSF